MFYYGSSNSETPVIRATSANDSIVAMVDAVLPHWEEIRDTKTVEWKASKEAEIARLQTTKTFWTRRTRTREEAVQAFNSIHEWGWNRTLWHTVSHAEQNISRLKEIRAIASEHAFENISLPEGDLRLLVGGPPEK